MMSWKIEISSPSVAGLAYRFCGPFGWEVSDVRECDSNDFGNARGEVRT